MPEVNTTKKAWTSFATFLVQNHILSEDLTRQASEQAQLEKSSLILYVLHHALVPDAPMAAAVAQHFSLPLFAIDSFDASLVPADLMNLQVVQKRLALPLFKQNNTLYLAVIDPSLASLNDLKFLTGCHIKLVVVAQEPLHHCIDALQNSQLISGLGDLDDEKLDQLNVSAYEEEPEGIEQLDTSVDSAPIVRYINKILLDAINKKASDIHFEPFEDFYRIRFRQDGILHKIASPPLRLSGFMVARIKVMANLNTAEKRVPQDGRFKLILSKKRAMDFRVSTCPTLFGEKVVMRILAPAQALPGIDSLGMQELQKKHLSDALERSQGIILVSGPTGSGKTVTLYTALNILNTMEENICTVEDPVEIPVAGINQVHVNQKTGLTFASALRSFLRQDPDVIMVGEIRDLETAEIAVKAAQTGHLVLSTVHTNSATETILRLANMGVASYNLASSLLVIIAQRLTRRLCDHCKTPVTLSLDILQREGFDVSGDSPFNCYDAVGCEHCYNGYKGRIGIFEVLPVSLKMIELILSGATAPQLSAQAREEGIADLRTSGLLKVKEGVTSLAELNRVFKG